ncbi:RHS repeat domain-containing protein [Novipirellula artificiosorum]|uniref:tRNA nuclease WapA n=1 Tax=Novipirellula artificiosorum TaxID=2528016 RepID=A0A5C6DVC4_9BACT|nr:RHS repeat-associated core domain-containing protein [Novipirellula artificiosorum]TWU40552.1 tRNA nuclease WapA precursor [Novipirellula artificiosorum]
MVAFAPSRRPCPPEPKRSTWSYADKPIISDGGGGLRYYHRNQQYSIIALTDGGGTVKERYAYDAYGTPTTLDASLSQLATSSENNRYTYTGREYDEALGLYHYRARMYDPVAGRFCSRDPIGFEGSPWNVYEYVGSRPIVNYDPFGHEISEIFLPSPRGVDINLFPQDDPLHAVARDMPFDGGKIVIGGHGYPNGIIKGSDNEPIYSPELIERVKSLSKFRPGMPILLLVCDAGKNKKMCQNLANGTGSTVWAAEAHCEYHFFTITSMGLLINVDFDYTEFVDEDKNVVWPFPTPPNGNPAMPLRGPVQGKPSKGISNNKYSSNFGLPA